MRIEWSPAARASARRYMVDQAGMRAVGVAVAALADPLRAGWEWIAAYRHWARW